MRNFTRVAAVMALATPAVLGFVGIADAQDKFKLGMAVGGNTCCEWMKAQGDVARAIAMCRDDFGYFGPITLSTDRQPAGSQTPAQSPLDDRS